jgi:hypothetical protein
MMREYVVNINLTYKKLITIMKKIITNLLKLKYFLKKLLLHSKYEYAFIS